MAKKTFKEIFSDICDGQLTSMEIEEFILKSTKGYNIPKLTTLIRDYEMFLLEEWCDDYSIFFQIIYGDRDGYLSESFLPPDSEIYNLIDNRVNEIKELYNKKFSVDNQKSIGKYTLVSPIFRNCKLYNSAIDPVVFIELTLIGLREQRFSAEWHELDDDAKEYWNEDVEHLKRIQKRFLDDLDDDFKFEVEIGVLDFLLSPAFHFHTELHVIYYLVSRNSMKQFASGPATPSQPNSPEREYSPKKCAQDFINDSGSKKYPEHVIEFVMARAERCDYDNIANLIREIRDDPECPDEIKDKNKDSKAERNWINYYYEKNKIPKGTMKKKLSSTSKN